MSERVDIIIVTYNSTATIEKALDIVMESVGAGLAKCLVVDNGSDDGTLSLLDRYRPHIEIIKSTNLGFASGCNIGIEASSSDYVLLLNPDSYLEFSELKKLVDFMDDNTCAGIAAPAILEDGREWQMVGDRTTPGTILKEALGVGNSRKVEVKHEDLPFRTSWVCGAIFMIRRDTLKAIGLFDERYFMYFEETDFCFRTEKSDHEIWSVGPSIGYHLGGGSTGSNEDVVNGCISRYYFPSRNHYISKNYGRFIAYFTFTTELVVVLVKIALKLLLKFKFDRMSWRFARYLTRYYILWN